MARPPNDDPLIVPCRQTLPPLDQSINVKSISRKSWSRSKKISSFQNSVIEDKSNGSNPQLCHRRYNRSFIPHIEPELWVVASLPSDLCAQSCTAEPLVLVHVFDHWSNLIPKKRTKAKKKRKIYMDLNSYFLTQEPDDAIQEIFSSIYVCVLMHVFVYIHCSPNNHLV